MTAAICTAIAVLAMGAAVRPRPAVRRFGQAPHRNSARPIWTRRRLGRRVGPVTAAEMAVWCESLARVVRSGSSLATAIRATDAPPGCRGEIGQIVLALDRGARLVDALEIESTSPHVDLALAVLRACARNGGPPAQPLDRAAATLRGRAADAAQRQTQSAQARLSATVMTVLPIAMLALLLATSSTTRAAAVSPSGIAAIVVGGALNLGGWHWMRRVISRVAT